MTKTEALPIVAHAEWLADKICSGGDYAKEAAALLVSQAAQLSALQAKIQQMALNHMASEGQWIEHTGKLQDEVERLRKALVYVAHSLHATPLHMLCKGVTLHDADGVTVSLDGWEVQARQAQKGGA